MNENDFSSASDSFKRRNSHLFPTHDSGLHSAKPECIEGLPLVSPEKRKVKSGAVSGGSVEKACRYRIGFRVFSTRPLDWDNYRFKDLQDCIVKAGILPDDDWGTLEGFVVSEKVHDKKDERTEICVHAIGKE